MSEKQLPDPVRTLDRARCPECGTDGGIRSTGDRSVPEDDSGRCPECGHRAPPLTFMDEWLIEHEDADPTSDQTKIDLNAIDYNA